MKGLSVRLPWWWFILHGGKDIENRDWWTNYRGPVLLHASKWFGAEEARADFYDARRIAEGRGVSLPDNVMLADLRAVGGCIVGRVDIVDCVSRSASPWFFGKFGFVLANPVRFATAVPFKGALGLFEVPDSILPPAISEVRR